VANLKFHSLSFRLILPPMHVVRILIIRFSSMGDVVLTTPVVRALKQQLDGEPEIHFMVKSAFAPLLERNPHIYKVHAFDGQLTEFLHGLEGIQFDYIIDLHNNLRSGLVKKRLKALSFTVDKVNFSKWLLVRFGIRRSNLTHIVTRYMDTLKAFSVEDDGQGLDIFLGDEDHIDAFPRYLPKASAFIAIATGANHEGKRLIADQLKAIVQAVSLPVILLGDQADRDWAEAIDWDNEEVYNACGELTILQSASLIGQAALLISGDTGLMHIGSALNTPLISVWGCTSPELGMAPYRPNSLSVIIEPIARSKRPCSKLGNRCKYGKDDLCITHVTTEQVTEAVDAIVSKLDIKIT
jgi:ADP-heptose:LPS heptosyltransferase